MREEKKVTYKHLKKGQKINGTEYGHGRSGFTAYVKEINPAFVTVNMWSPKGELRKIDAASMFLIEMTDEEIREKYNEKTAEIVKKIQNTLLYDEIGYHEMYNAWLSSDPWELTQACIKQKLTVIGHCRDIIPKTSMVGDKLDVGVCVEDEDGDRFWCHFRYEEIKILVKSYDKYQEWKKNGKKEDVEYILFLARDEAEREKQNVN